MKDKDKDKQKNDNGAAAVESWRVADLVPHPDNPRTVNIHSPKFADLVASIRANGILEPLTVRQIAGQAVCEVLSGHRRLAAAVQLELEWVPVRNLGLLGDERAYDIVAMANLHEELTPLEEGRRAACWLDKYGGDVEAVASKLGKTPAWVVQHAQIARGLSAEWQKEILETNDGNGRPKWSRWTAGHLAVIARLPVSLQAHYLQKVRSDYRFGYWPQWTVKQIEEAVKVDRLYLVKAPFDAYVCRDCINRTDRQPLLWAEVAEEAAGDKARCLDKACWEKQCRAFARRQFRDVCEQKGVPAAVPISLLEEPKDWTGRCEYEQKIRELKKRYKGLLTADEFGVVEPGDDGAVPASVVAGARGRGHLAVKYIAQGQAATVEKRKEVVVAGAMDAAVLERHRWREVETRLKAEIQAAERPSLAILAVLSHCLDCECYGWLEEAAAVYGAKRTGPEEFTEWVADLLWRDIKNELESMCWSGLGEGDCVAMGLFFGLDAQAMHDEIVAAEKSGATEGTEDTEKKKEVPAKKGRRKAVTT